MLIGVLRKVLSYVVAIGSKDCVNIDRYVIAKLLNHSGVLNTVPQVLVTPMESNVILAFQHRPYRFLAIERTAVRGLKTCVESAELLPDLCAPMSGVIVEAEIRARSIRVLEGAGQLDEELFDIGDICSWCLHI